MEKILAISNHKGGPGKTTLSMQILDIASNTTYGYGLRVLAIDVDPQGSLTDTLQLAGKPGLYDFVINSVDTRIRISKTLDFITCTNAASIYETLKTNGEPFPETALSDDLEEIKDQYDLIILDCPPENDFLNNLVYMATNEVIVPITADEYSLKGLILLSKRIKKVCRFNPEIHIGGIVINRVNVQTKSFKDTYESANAMADAYNTRVFRAIIPCSTVVDDAQKNKQSVMKYAPKAKVSYQFSSLVAEILGLECSHEI